MSFPTGWPGQWACGAGKWQKRGTRKRGLRRYKEGLAAYRATGAELYRPYFLCSLAEACMETGRFDDGLNALTEALAFADENEVGFSRAEIPRLRGRLRVRLNYSHTSEAPVYIGSPIVDGTPQRDKHSATPY